MLGRALNKLLTIVSVNIVFEMIKSKVVLSQTRKCNTALKSHENLNT